METYIKVEDVEKYYGSSGIITKAVERVSFEISKGEFIGSMGESGSGKTSLLNVLATIDTATAGYAFGGRNSLSWKRYYKNERGR